MQRGSRVLAAGTPGAPERHSRKTCRRCPALGHHQQSGSKAEQDALKAPAPTPPWPSCRLARSPQRPPSMKARMGDVFHSWALAREAARARWTSGAIVAARSARRYSSCVACHTCVRSCGCPCNAGSPQHSLRAAPWPVSTSLRAQRSRCRCLSAAAVIQLPSPERRLLSAQAPHQHSREERRRIRHVRPLRRARWEGQRVRSVTTTGRSQSRRPWDRTRHPLPGERRGGVSASERSTVERASQCASPARAASKGGGTPRTPLFACI